MYFFLCAEKKGHDALSSSLRLSAWWGQLVALLSFGLEYASVSTCDFPLTKKLLKVWIHKPLHTPLLCGREAELKIGRFGGIEQPALCEALKNTLTRVLAFSLHIVYMCQ